MPLRKETFKDHFRNTDDSHPIPETPPPSPFLLRAGGLSGGVYLKCTAPGYGQCGGMPVSAARSRTKRYKYLLRLRHRRPFDLLSISRRRSATTPIIPWRLEVGRVGVAIDSLTTIFDIIFDACRKYQSPQLPQQSTRQPSILPHYISRKKKRRSRALISISFQGTIQNDIPEGVRCAWHLHLSPSPVDARCHRHFSVKLRR